MIVKITKKVKVKVALVFLSYFCFIGVSLHAMESACAIEQLPSLQVPALKRSPLRSAVIAGNEPLVRELLSTGAAEVDEVDAEQRTALHIMLAGSHTPRTEKMVRVLLQHKASVVCPDNYGIRPLDYVCFQTDALYTIFFNWLCKESKAVIQEV